MEINNPRFPLYIPSKSRSEYMITSTVLTELKVPHYIVVEPDQVEAYRDAIVKRGLLTTILPLDLRYKEHYELCDDLGMSKSTGPGPARNFAWDHAISLGFPWHWVMDDNITSFRRLNKNEKVKVSNAAIFKAMEDFVLRYKNIGMAGPNYFMFAPARGRLKPFVMNTRIYSCNLIRNDVPFRWRGRYNEDTILSLDMLKSRWCTVQFNAFLQQKMPTQLIGGGNSKEFYFEEGRKEKSDRYADKGTLAKSQMQVKVHPDVSRLVWKFQRWHHHVDYSQWKNMPIVRREDVVIGKGINNYGMELKTKENSVP